MHSVNSFAYYRTIIMRKFWCFVLVIYRFNCETWNATNFIQLTDRHWSQLSFEDQRKLLEFEIEFQGIQIPLKYVLAADAKSLECLPINDVLSHEMTLGMDVRFNDSECSNENRFLQNNTKSVDSSDGYDEVEMRTIIADARINKGVYLSDLPDEDLQRLSKVVAQKIKKKLPWYWIVSVDLQSVDNTAEKFESGDAISEYISTNVLNLTNFEWKAFQDFFASNRVIFLVTISADVNVKGNHKEINLLNAIKRKSDNQLWLFSSVRDLDLASRLSLKAYRRLPREDHYRIVSKDLTDKRDRLTTILAALANITIENSINCADDADDSDETLYEIFKHYIDIIISSQETQTLTAKDVESIYQNRAFQILFPKHYQEQLVESWFPKLPNATFSSPSFDQSTINRSLIHPATAKYFVVEFFRQRLFASDKKITNSIPNTLKAILYDWDHYKMVRALLEGVYKLLFSDTSNPEALNRAVKYFQQFYSFEELQRLLIRAISLGDINTVKVLAKTFENNPRELCRLFNYRGGAVNSVAEYQSVDFTEMLLKLLRDQLDVDCFRNLFLEKGVHQRNPMFFFSEKIDSFDFLLNHPIVPLTSNEKADLLVEIDKSGDSVLRYVLFFHKIRSFSNVLKAMGHMFDKEHATELLTNGTFFDRFHSIDFNLVSPEVFDVLRYWSEAYALHNETKEIFVMDNFRNLNSRLFGDANVFVVEAFWTFFEAIYRSTSERKVFLDHNGKVFQNAMNNTDRKVFTLVKEKYDAIFGPQKCKDVIWGLMLDSINRYRRPNEIDFYWPFFEEIFRNREERRAKLMEKDYYHRTLLYRAWESLDKYLLVLGKYSELLSPYEIRLAKICESDLPWYRKFLIYLGIVSGSNYLVQ